MHDIKAIRADPAAFDAGLARRGVEPASFEASRLANSASATQTNLDLVRVRQKMAAEAYARSRAASSNVVETSDYASTDDYAVLVNQQSELMDQVAADKVRERELDVQLTAQRASASALLATLPNLPASDVPDGLDETANVVVHARGTLPAFDFAPAEHDVLAARFGYDPDAAAAIAGARFAILKGSLARLHRALGQWMLDANVAAGWTEVAPPVLVHERAMFGTGQLPKFAEDAFRTTDDRYLIPTAEVSLTNSIRGRVLDADELPLRLTALTPCFRAEAGSAGRDTRGLIRQHQFDKVELVAIVADAAAAAAVHEAMTAQAESLLDALQLPYRRVLLCAGDMGFSARKTFDLEVWLPGQGRYREISSVSDCGDFQARRMDVHEPKGGRYKVRGQKGTHFVHTLNGSALAVGRTLVAVLENHQRADGSVAVPEVLRSYMGGVTALRPA
ncbi:MAG: serine--tRNA ligase [Sphingomonadaceae bacterium]|nr:serine--tRNA ligase [Sphingomonadaceae bacterium]